MSRDQGLRIGQLAALCGVSTRTVDYYTRVGLLEPAARTDGNFRLYEPEAATRLSQVKELQQRRLSLEEIRDRLTRDEVDETVATLRELCGELEAIHRRLASVNDLSQVDATVSAMARTGLRHALAISACLQEVARRGGMTPPKERPRA